MSLLSEGESRIKHAMQEHPTWKTWALACALALVLLALCLGALVRVSGTSVDSEVESAAGSASGMTQAVSGSGAATGTEGSAGSAEGAIGGAVANGADASGFDADGSMGSTEASGSSSEGAAQQVETPTQANAFMAAKLHMSEMPYSHEGLVSVLEAEGYSHEDALYAVDKLGVDWNTKAAEMAAQYVDTMEFTREDLVDQLMYEGFSREQAEAGVAAIGM